MLSTRWTYHRYNPGGGSPTFGGMVPINLWRVAHAAALETLQGAPLVHSWLSLFRSHLSQREPRLLRWGGDFAESAEMRRAYSGLYGRFFARALLSHHLSITRFVSLKRDGISLHNSISVDRNTNGDIPDWLGWDARRSRFVLAEAKGSLSSDDFMRYDGPSCIHAGKAQFSRVSATIGSRPVQPDRWVAATRWSTDVRGGTPISILWDPPSDDAAFSEEEAMQHRAAIDKAWLNSIAPGLGWSNGSELTDQARERSAVFVSAAPGPIPENEDWPFAASDKSRQSKVDVGSSPPTVPYDIQYALRRQIFQEAREDWPLPEASLFAENRRLLEVDAPEEVHHQQKYSSALVTRFGVRPIRTKADYDELLRSQERAQRLIEPAMLIGLPLNFTSEIETKQIEWLDGAGIAPPHDLAVFDLRRIKLDGLG